MLRVVVQQLQPFLRRVVRRQQFPFTELRINRRKEVFQGHPLLGRHPPRRLNGPFDGTLLRALDNGSQNRAVHKIGPVEHLALSAAKPYRQQAVLLGPLENGLDDLVGQLSADGCLITRTRSEQGGV